MIPDPLTPWFPIRRFLNPDSERIAMNLEQLARISLANLPTPIDELPRLSQELGGPRLLVKRDDQTGLATGGNKTRKLEFLIAEALANGADTVITAGAAQSNHCRQTAAAAAQAGLDCVLALGGEPPPTTTGNLLLIQLLGAQIYWTGPDRRGERLEEIANQVRADGRQPYVVPYGGSNVVGATGYVLAMQELNEQLRGLGVDRIVFASSSGGTQAGMVVGARATGFGGEIIGIRIDKGEAGDDPYPIHLAKLANETATHVGLDAEFTPDDFLVVQDYLGAGYGVVGELEREAIRLAAGLEGLILDPVYTGRAMGGLIDMIRRGVIGPAETVLFWHTGGTPALFAYADALV
jgi:D-cysteine desulfhydrase family pyridoxal phosphate-dependent enzyme